MTAKSAPLPTSPAVKPDVPDTLRLADALQRSAPLASLRARLRDSAERLEAIRSSLPGPLRTQVLPGPVDDDGWSLLAANGSVAAKLRQLKPRLEAVLVERGWQVSSIRIRVQSK